MTARYTAAEKAAAKRIGYSPVLKGEAPSAAWLADFKRLIVNGATSDARYYRSSAARVLRDAQKESDRLQRLAVRSIFYSHDARKVANAIAREQRKAARS